MAARLLTKDSAGELKRKSRSQPDLFHVSVEATKTIPHSRINSLDEDLLELCELSGVKVSPDVFDIVLDLLRLNVNPNTIADVLKKMTSHKASATNREAARSKTHVQRHGSDNSNSRSSTSKNKSSSLTAVLDTANVNRAQSLY